MNRTTVFLLPKANQIYSADIYQVNRNENDHKSCNQSTVNAEVENVTNIWETERLSSTFQQLPKGRLPHTQSTNIHDPSS